MTSAPSNGVYTHGSQPGGAGMQLDLWGLSVRASFMRGSSMRRVCIPQILLDQPNTPREANSVRRSRRVFAARGHTRSSSEHSDRRSRKNLGSQSFRFRSVSRRLEGSRYSYGSNRSAFEFERTAELTLTAVLLNEQMSRTLSRMASFNLSRELRSLASSMMNAQEREMFKTAIRDFRRDRSVNGLYKLCRIVFACIDLHRKQSNVQLRNKKFKFISVLRISLPIGLRGEFDELCSLYAPDYEPQASSDENDKIVWNKESGRANSLPNLYMSDTQRPRSPSRSFSIQNRRIGVGMGRPYVPVSLSAKGHAAS